MVKVNSAVSIELCYLKPAKLLSCGHTIHFRTMPYHSVVLLLGKEIVYQAILHNGILVTVGYLLRRGAKGCYIVLLYVGCRKSLAIAAD